MVDDKVKQSATAGSLVDAETQLLATIGGLEKDKVGLAIA